MKANKILACILAASAITACVTPAQPRDAGVLSDIVSEQAHAPITDLDASLTDAADAFDSGRDGADTQ